MIDDMIREVSDHMAEVKRADEEMQQAYEDTMRDATTTRADDLKLVITKINSAQQKTKR